MRNYKKIKTGVVSLVIISSLSACANSTNEDADVEGTADMEITTEAEDAQESASTQGIESLKPVLTFEKALDLFYTTFEKETMNFESIKFSKDASGNYRYLIEGWDDSRHYTLELNVGTAEVIEQQTRGLAEHSGILDLEAAITPKEAMDAALEKTDDGAVEEWVLEVDENNRMVYRIYLLSGEIQKVDGLTGRVL